MPLVIQSSCVLIFGYEIEIRILTFGSIEFACALIVKSGPTSDFQADSKGNISFEQCTRRHTLYTSWNDLCMKFVDVLILFKLAK